MFVPPPDFAKFQEGAANYRSEFNAFYQGLIEKRTITNETIEELTGAQGKFADVVSTTFEETEKYIQMQKDVIRWMEDLVEEQGRQLEHFDKMGYELDDY